MASAPAAAANSRATPRCSSARRPGHQHHGQRAERRQQHEGGQDGKSGEPASHQKRRSWSAGSSRGRRTTPVGDAEGVDADEAGLDVRSRRPTPPTSVATPFTAPSMTWRSNQATASNAWVAGPAHERARWPRRSTRRGPGPRLDRPGPGGAGRRPTATAMPTRAATIATTARADLGARGHVDVRPRSPRPPARASARGTWCRR